MQQNRKCLKVILQKQFNFISLKHKGKDYGKRYSKKTF